MGIVHPGSYCNGDETKPHYWAGADAASGFVLFRCARCRKHLILPMAFSEAINLGHMMSRYGQNEGYCRFLNRHRAAKIGIAKVQYLEKLSSVIEDEVEFARLVDKILNDKEYDRI